MPSDSGVTIEPLDENNYATWAARVRFLLIKKELWGETTSEVLLNQVKNDKALAEIGLHVKEHHLALVTSCTRAYEAWQKLEAIYKSKGQARKIQLRRELNTLKKDVSEPISKYVARAQSLKSDLAAVGHNVSDEDVAYSILAGLPKEYEIASSILEAQETTLTPDVILSKLLMVEQRLARENKEETDAAAFAARRRPDAHDYGTKRVNVNKKDVKCYHCGKTGHMKRDCYKWQAQNAQQGSSKPVYHAGTALVAPRHVNVGCWILDSGASQHMTGNKDILENYEELATPVSITWGDGHVAHGVGRGTAVLLAKSKMPVTLREVLYVPSLAYNLLSISKATSAGATVYITQDTVTLVKGGTAVLKGVREEDLYYVHDAHAGERALKAATVENANLWHRRFCHLGYNNLAKLASKSMVTGMTTTAKDFHSAAEKKCEVCIMSKHTREAFPESSTKSTRRLELIHMDVQGPFQTTSLGGMKYNATFLDDYSDLGVVRPVPSKDRVPDIVIEVIEMLENQCGERVRAVRSDRGGEYVNHRLRRYFGQKGIVHQTTAPYSPQQNGSAERLNRTLVEKVRAELQGAQLEKDLWAEAMVTANYVRNRSPVRSSDSKTPWELFFGQKPDVSHLRVFGSTAYAQVPKALRRKLDPTSNKGVFVGYEANSKAYRILMQNPRRIIVSRDVIFRRAGWEGDSRWSCR